MKEEPLFGIIVAGLLLYPIWIIAMIPYSLGHYFVEALQALMEDIK